jgi:hypothetical protein
LYAAQVASLQACRNVTDPALNILQLDYAELDNDRYLPTALHNFPFLGRHGAIAGCIRNIKLFISCVIFVQFVKVNNEPGGTMVWYPREMKRTNVSGVYPSSASGGLGHDYREEE